MDELIRKMQEDSGKVIPMVPKTVRFSQEFLDWCADFCDEYGIRESVLIRTATEIGWEKLRGKASR